MAMDVVPACMRLRIENHKKNIGQWREEQKRREEKRKRRAGSAEGMGQENE